MSERRRSRRSSRPTTSAGLYGERDRRRRRPTSIGRSFARVIAALEDKPTSELRLGLGHDMRLTAPELAAAYRDGMCSEGATVLDAGEVGTEVLYYLVGSRGLDGGLMCTASHNPKAYTGVKLVGRGALALSGDAGIGGRPRPDRRRPSGSPRWTARSSEVSIIDEFQRGRTAVHRRRRDAAAEGRRRRRQRDGRADGRAAAGTPRARLGRGLLDARWRVP